MTTSIDMFRSARYTICLILLALSSAQATHYRVYFLGGQSNGNGRGDAAQLTEPLASPQTDVRFYWHRTQAAANVLANAIFDTSDSGSPGFNLADVTGADQAAAAAAGDFFSFTLQSSGDAVVYQSLTFYANQYGTTNKVDISYRIGAGSEVFILQNLLPTTGNAPVTLETVDFDDFSTSEDVTWTFYLHGASQSNFGTRFDDMTLYGESSPSTGNESVDRGFFRVELLP